MESKINSIILIIKYLSNMTIWVIILLSTTCLAVGGWFGKYISEREAKRTNQTIQDKLDQAREKSEIILDKARESADREADRIIKRWENQAKDILEEAKRKLQSSTDQEEQNKKIKKELEWKKQTLEDLIKEESWKLSEIAKLTEAEAKEELFKNIERTESSEIEKFIEKFKQEKNESAKQEAGNILSKILPRVAVQASSEFLVSVVDLPSEDYKWRIIWREGRNIAFFEKTTWVELAMDDSPGIVKISSFDTEKKYLAVQTLKKLVKDGRINPSYIEKYYNECIENFDEDMKTIGRKTLLELWVPMMNSELLLYIWKFSLRFSYWQNLLAHSKEVASIAELIASELGYDSALAKKAGLLHDIGKIDTSSGESHAAIWGKILKNLWMNETVINTAEWHHFDVDITTPIGWIVTAADAISAGREGVRLNSKEKFTERMSTLEELVKNTHWIKKAYIMQAGREIWAFVDPEKVRDLEMEKISKNIAVSIEWGLDYPGIIRVVLIRENKTVTFVQ